MLIFPSRTISKVIDRESSDEFLGVLIDFFLKKINTNKYDYIQNQTQFPELSDYLMTTKTTKYRWKLDLSRGIVGIYLQYNKRNRKKTIETSFLAI